MDLKASLIIPTKDRPHDLDLCVDSIMQQDLLPNEVIVIDDGNLGSEFIHGLKARIEMKGIAFLYSKKTVCGICKSRNLGARLASHDILFFVDDDIIILDKQYINSIVKVYEIDIDGRIGGVQGPFIENMNKTKIKLRDKIWFGLEMLFCVRSRKFGKILRSSFESSTSFVFSEIKKVDYLSGCCSYRKEVFKEYSYDECFEHAKGNSYREDSDFSYRVSGKYELIFLPHALILHTHSPSSRLMGLQVSRLMVRNSYCFFRKNMLNKTIINYVCFIWAMIGLLCIRVLFYVGRPRKNRFDEIKGILCGYYDIFNIIKTK